MFRKMSVQRSSSACWSRSSHDASGSVIGVDSFAFPGADEIRPALPGPPLGPARAAACELGLKEGPTQHRLALLHLAALFHATRKFDEALDTLDQVEFTAGLVDDERDLVPVLHARAEVLELAGEARRRVVLLCHSKGGCDATAALALFPELLEENVDLVKFPAEL